MEDGTEVPQPYTPASSSVPNGAHDSPAPDLPISDDPVLAKIALENAQLELKARELELKARELDLRARESELKRRDAELEIDLEAKRLANLAKKTEIESLEEKQQIDAQDRVEDRKDRRQLTWFKMLASSVLLISGVWLTSQGDNLGSYLLGAGATAAGLQSATILEKRKTSADDSAGKISGSKASNSNDKVEEV